jgi:hypothetical protein
MTKISFNWDNLRRLRFLPGKKLLRQPLSLAGTYQTRLSDIQTDRQTDWQTDYPSTEQCAVIHANVIKYQTQYNSFDLIVNILCTHCTCCLWYFIAPSFVWIDAVTYNDKLSRKRSSLVLPRVSRLVLFQRHSTSKSCKHTSGARSQRNDFYIAQALCYRRQNRWVTETTKTSRGSESLRTHWLLRFVPQCLNGSVAPGPMQPIHFVIIRSSQTQICC